MGGALPPTGAPSRYPSGAGRVMRMSCGGWTGGSRPGSPPGSHPSSGAPRRGSLAYRRYLRFLPGYSGTPKEGQDAPAIYPEELVPPSEESDYLEDEQSIDDMIGLSSARGKENEEGPLALLVKEDKCDRGKSPPEDSSRRKKKKEEKEILRERGLNRWWRDQENCLASSTDCSQFPDNAFGAEEDKDRKDDADKEVPDVVSVSSLVRQYTAMINARNSSSNSSLLPNALQTSRSCSSIFTKNPNFSHLCGPSSSHGGRGDDRKDGRHGSIDSGDGDSSDSLLGSRCRSFSLPWSSEASWRWSSDPNIMHNATAPPPPAVGVPSKPSSRSIVQHRNSLARLDSGTSDEGCPRDDSTGPTPPLSPVFRGLGPNHHLAGLITPFKSLSPASSMGSHLGSVEDIPLARSMSFGHVMDRLSRSRSADSAVEVEEDSGQQRQQQQQQQYSQGEPKIDVERNITCDGVKVSVKGVGNISNDLSDFGKSDESVSKEMCCDSVECRIAEVDGEGKGSSFDGDSKDKLPNGEIQCVDVNTSEVCCECGAKEISKSNEILRSCDQEQDRDGLGSPSTSHSQDHDKASECDQDRGLDDLPKETVTVELRRKENKPSNHAEKRERRCGEVDGDLLLRRARGCGGIAGTGMFQDIPDDDSGRSALRTPSVVISDHSGDTVSLTVALASSDFSIDKLDDKFQPPPSVSPSSVSPSSSSPSLCVDDDASRKVSSCSSCSSVSTVDMTTPLTPMLTPCLDSLMEIPNRRISDCSTISNISISEDEIEQPLPQPPAPKKQSNWRKVRNIVQWTPFIQTYKKHKYPWVQLAGHQGNFKAGYKQGTILKKLCPPEEKALEAIMKDVLRPYVPLYMGVVEGIDGEKYLQLQDLLSDFELPCVMDIKMGVRTYLEDELAKAREKPKLRKDMYEKMVQIDPKAPTEAEQRAKAVTKPRYMVWRETISSTATQGFRIEGVRRGDGTSSKDFKTTRTREQVLASLNSFLQGYPHAASRYVQQLKSIKVTLEASPFFNSHELIGSSLLFVHNETSAAVRMIDFAKTIPLPENVHITHRSPWSEGTHEDGYLLGLDNLIELFSLAANESGKAETPKTETQNSTQQGQTNSSSSITKDTSVGSKSSDSNSNGSSATTSTTISNPLPSITNHTPVPVNASLS